MKTRFCLALDGLTPKAGYDMAWKLRERFYAVKLHAALDAGGPDILKDFRRMGMTVWVDAKLHDTPCTVSERVRALISHGANIVTVHASGGVAMMQAAVESALEQKRYPPPEIWAVTLLTSLSKKEIGRIYGAERTPAEISRELGHMAKQCGIHTIVCSAQEVGVLSQDPPLRGMTFAVPGTRLNGNAGGHERFATPGEAIADGADILVIGREVTRTSNPEAAFDAIVEAIPDQRRRA